MPLTAVVADTAAAARSAADCVASEPIRAALALFAAAAARLARAPRLASCAVRFCPLPLAAQAEDEEGRERVVQRKGMIHKAISLAKAVAPALYSQLPPVRHG